MYSGVPTTKPVLVIVGERTASEVIEYPGPKVENRRATPKSSSLSCATSPVRKEQIRRLEIAMDDAAMMGKRQGLGDALAAEQALGQDSGPRSRRWPRSSPSSHSIAR